MPKIPSLDTEAIAKQAAAARPYLQQMLRDAEVQDSLRDLFDNSRKRVRDERRKARRKRAASSDDLHERLLAVLNAAGGVFASMHEPPPPPPRRGRKLVFLVIGAGVAYVAVDSDARAKVAALLGQSE